MTLLPFFMNELKMLLRIRNMVYLLNFQEKRKNLQNKKPDPQRDRAWRSGLAVTYFRMRMHTIIGANPFHGPVRDGKAWVQAAMAARLTLSSPLKRDVPPSARAAIRLK